MTLLEKFKGTLTAQNVYLDENTGGKGKYFKARFLQPGLVKYSFGVCVLEKDTIDKFINGFVGCPVIIGHKDVTSENAKELSCGNICHIWYDDLDGWYWGDGIIDNDEALELINQGYNVSCQYEITEYANNTTNALHNGNPYDKVILNGKPEHLAIVDKPRYENAMIAMNALDLTAENEDKWITIKPNGEDAKGKHLLIKEGESVQEALQRTYGIDGAKGQQKLFDTKGDRKTKEDFKHEKDEKQKKYDEIDKIHQENVKKEAAEKADKRKKAIQDYLDGKITPEELEKNAPNLSFWEWIDLADKKHAKEDEKKAEPKEEKEKPKKYTWKDKEYSLEELVHEGFDPIEYSGSIYKEDKQRKYIEKTEGSKSYRLPVSDEDFKKVGEYKQQREAKKLQQDKEKSKDLTDYIKWQYSADIEPHITGYVNNKTLVEWDKLPRETQSALKRLDFDNKINLEQYSGSEMSIAVKDKKIFDSLKKHKESKAKNCIVQAINEIKETDMFKKLFNRKEQQMEKDEMKSLFIECLNECLQAKNEEDKKDDKEDEKEEDLKKEEAENKCKNEVVDKRDIIRQIMAIAGKEEASEDVKTIAKLAEKLAYEKSEADDKADNEEDEKKKEEAKNKAKNSIEEMKAMFSQTEVKKATSNYITRDDAIALGNELF